VRIGNDRQLCPLRLRCAQSSSTLQYAWDRRLSPSIGVVAPLFPRRHSVVLRIIAINVADTRNEEKSEMTRAELVVMLATMRDATGRTAVRLWPMQERTRCGIGYQCYRHCHQAQNTQHEAWHNHARSPKCLWTPLNGWREADIHMISTSR
jgi:hypothetical protein